MPPRHFVVILLSAVVSLCCYQITAKNRLANLVAVAGELIATQSLYPADREQLLTSAINGMLENLDVHSYYLSGIDADDRLEFLNQSYAGLGIHIRREPTNQAILIVKPIYGGPAAEMGLAPGDQITHIDSRPVAEISSFDEIRTLLKGPEGTQVQLDVQRWQEPTQDWLSWSVSVPRRQIPTYTVVGDRPNETGGWYFTLDSQPDVGYIRIKQFGSRTVEELQQAVNQIDGRVSSLILDLRENGGGLLEAAIGVCDLFLDQDEQTIVSIRNRAGQVQQIFTATAGRGMKQPVPMVVLINPGSASASEIVAACFQDHQIATIVGDQTFGKGTVQTQFSLPRPRTFLNLTTASYWRPSGRNIHRMRWRAAEKNLSAAQDIATDEAWGVRPERDDLTIRLNLRDRSILAALYDRRELGLPLDDIEERLREMSEQMAAAAAAAEAESAVPDGEQTSDGEETRSGAAVKPTTPDEPPDQISLEDPRTLHQRDPQLQRAIQLLTAPSGQPVAERSPATSIEKPRP